MSEEKQLLIKLKQEVESLKKNIADPSAKSRELMLEMESLKDSIHELNLIFQKALKETKEEDLSVMLKVMKENLATVISQNETLARGIVALADKFDIQGGDRNKPVAPQAFMGAPQMFRDRMAPRPNFNMPPPPPQPLSAPKKKRTGLF